MPSQTQLATVYIIESYHIQDKYLARYAGQVPGAPGKIFELVLTGNDFV
jgi:hypothetical protein